MIGLAVGLAIFVWLIAWQGVANIVDLLLRSGWSLLLVPLVWTPNLFMNTRSWQLQFRQDEAPSYWRAFIAQWIGRAINTLLPVASIGGEIVKARMLVLWGTDVTHASAATVVDKTVQVMTTILWGLMGLMLLAYVAVDDSLVVPGLIGMAALALGAVGFFVVQRLGMFRLAVDFAHKTTKFEVFAGLAGTAGAIDGLIRDSYLRHGRFYGAIAWRMGALIVQFGEVWLAATLLGHPVTILEAIMIKSLTSTLSDAAFVVPNSYGIQEGAFIVLGALVGWTPDVALTVSLVVRIREIVVDIPGLLLWQHAEGRALLHRR